MASPASWYEDFPGWSPRVVSALPPFNEHLAFDTGAGLFATGLLLLLAGLVLRRDVTIIATIGYLAFSLPHAVFHLRHPGDDLSTAEDALNSGALWLAAVLVAYWLAIGTLFWAYLEVVGSTATGWGRTVGAFGVSWGLGFFALFAPQGLGVFEGALVSVLDWGADAVLLVAGFRAVLLVRDLLLTAVAEVIARRGRAGA